MAPPGFTLVELIMVLIVLAIAAAMIIPQAVGTSDLRAQSAARVVVADLEYAQNHAIVTQTNISVTFDVSANSYRVSNESGTLSHPITKQAYEVDFDTKRGFGSVSIAAVSFGGAPLVTFDSLGAPSTGGTVDLAAGEHTYRVTVAPVTGRVAVANVP
ncbi:MAG: hypothetical protein AMJ81_01610 [Phycisphaerae bacterium SM23_33]|nr:MAG: hypothetical protein AMJ81_01610 [Phycisphaerae bacterium SM23_33]